jgi:hypothetical protein
MSGLDLFGAACRKDAMETIQCKSCKKEVKKKNAMHQYCGDKCKRDLIKKRRKNGTLT